MSSPACAAFAAGVALLLFLPVLPDAAIPALLGVACLVLSLRIRQLLVPAWLLLGSAWGIWHASAYLADRIPDILEGSPLSVQVRIAGLPEPTAHGRISIRVKPLRSHDTFRHFPAGRQWVLNAPAADYRPGESWLMTVSLKRPHGAASPDAFDYEEWLMSEGITATGIVRKAQRVSFGTESVDAWRLRIREQFTPLIADKPEAAIALSLLTGDRALVSDDLVGMYQAAGISHLLAISGPHVLLFAAGMVSLLRLLVGLRPAIYRQLPFSRWQWPVLLLAALAYGALAGNSLPTRRTLVMLALCAMTRMAGRETDAWAVLWRSLALVLLWQPLSVHAAGFWLSFAAVALIMLWDGRRQPGGSLRQAASLQGYLFLAMLPLGLLFFGQVSLVSPLANAAAIPLISLIVVPLLLVGLIAGFGWTDAGMACWYWAATILEGLGQWLAWLVGEGQALLSWRPGGAALLFLTLALLVWFFPRRLVPREISLALLLPVFLVRQPPAPGELQMAVLDVGQGLSVLLRTRHHALLYDTGPTPLAAQGVILPYLYGAGIRKLDRLVVSHNDLDHTGGADKVIRTMPVDSVFFSAPPEGYRLRPDSQRYFCRAGMSWQWDGVSFDMLGPVSARPDMTDNNRSCVLKVGGQGFSVLLTGDIEAAAEQALLDSGANLQARWLVLPHHGSKTSSTPDFLKAVSPQTGIVSAGYRNRFGHPAPKVVARYRLLGIPLESTVTSGSLVYTLRPGGDFVRQEWRPGRHYWHNSP
ncbi:MAG TPA: DNA internalization-related competence protein ComEC/Rec2 [Fluviicoccus sp.]|nr:DNA internalization-related competence protein ComEC/Rec2 [Fluviicoccus sp.]